jgi:ribonuclease-3
MASSPIETHLGYEFADEGLLRRALTHRSFSYLHNERLEYLGDSVLSCAVANLLFETFPALDEGVLSRVRSNLVKQQTLFEIAVALRLSEHLKLGASERESGGLKRPSILADAFEALLGAVFRDGGFEAVSKVVRRIYIPILKNVDPKTLGKDPKTRLQERLQGNRIPLPTYTVLGTRGAQHEQIFEVACAVEQLNMTVTGTGPNRRAAEQDAALRMLDALSRASTADPQYAAPAVEVATEEARPENRVDEIDASEA